MTHELRIIDLYRRIGEFNKAYECIEALKCAPEYKCDNTLVQYVTQEEQLLIHRDMDMV